MVSEEAFRAFFMQGGQRYAENKNHPAVRKTFLVTMNCKANFLGLGWVATPAGLKAMESLAKLEEERREAADDKREVDRFAGELQRVQKNRETQNTYDKQSRRGLKVESEKKRKAMPRGVASNEMCTFLILNILSLQLIPVNVIAYRSQYGSVNPTAIVGPGIVATAVSTAVAVAFCKVMDRERRA